MEFPQQNQQNQEPVKRPRGRPPVKAQFPPDSARDSVQIVKSEYVKKDDNGIPKKIMTVAEAKNLQGVEKKPLSDAQKANLKRMLELNKARRDATKKVEIPEEVPEGYDAIYVPPKKTSALSSQARESLNPSPAPQSSIPSEWLDMMRQMNDRMNQLTTQYTKPKEAKAKPRPPKKQSRRKDETSDTQAETDTETGYDTSDTEYVKKYEKKAARRIEAVKEIEAKLKKPVPTPPAPKPKGKYDGLSLF